VPLTRDHLSAISGITPEGRLFFRAQADAFRGPTVVAFLRQLARQVPGRLLVLWDGAPIHRAQPVKDFLQTVTGRRVWLVSLPKYAPETNPDEAVWQYLKHVELPNLCCGDHDELRAELQLAVRRLQRKPHIIQGCFRHAGYSL
jgi:transposase